MVLLQCIADVCKLPWLATYLLKLALLSIGL